MDNYHYLRKRKTTFQMFTQFKQYLTSKGITPEEQLEEQITFLKDGLYYLFVYEKSDPNYFRIILPNVFRIENIENKNRYSSLVNDINQKFKVAKTYINTENMIWIATDQFVYSREGIELMFERCITVLKIVLDDFREQQKSIKL